MELKFFILGISKSDGKAQERQHQECLKCSVQEVQTMREQWLLSLDHGPYQNVVYFIDPRKPLNLNIIQIDAPTSSSSDDNIEQFYKDLEQAKARTTGP